jgi:hypothetical protein
VDKSISEKEGIAKSIEGFDSFSSNFWSIGIGQG